METKNKKLPVGIEMFRDIREHDFYYIDKTGFIKELLESWTEVNLFTRPRPVSYTHLLQEAAGSH